MVQQPALQEFRKPVGQAVFLYAVSGGGYTAPLNMKGEGVFQGKDLEGGGSYARSDEGADCPGQRVGLIVLSADP